MHRSEQNFPLTRRAIIPIVVCIKVFDKCSLNIAQNAWSSLAQNLKLPKRENNRWKYRMVHFLAFTQAYAFLSSSSIPTKNGSTSSAATSFISFIQRKTFAWCLKYSGIQNMEPEKTHFTIRRATLPAASICAGSPPPATCTTCMKIGSIDGNKWLTSHSMGSLLSRERNSKCFNNKRTTCKVCVVLVKSPPCRAVWI